MIQKPISTPWLKCETPQLSTVLGYKFNHLAINSTTDLAGEADIDSSLSASAKHNSGWIEGQVVQSVSAHGGLKVKKRDTILSCATLKTFLWMVEMVRSTLITSPHISNLRSHDLYKRDCLTRHKIVCL